MSFSSSIKQELYSLKPNDFDSLTAEVYGLILFSKNFSNDSFCFTSRSRKSIEILSNFLSEQLSITVDISTKLYHNRSSRELNYTLSLVDKNDVNKIVSFFYKDADLKNLYINTANIKKDTQLKYFLKGIFLVCGSVINPQKEYRLEFAIQNISLANDLLKLLSNLPIKLNPKILVKKDKFSIYIKDNEQIFDFLAYIGAQNSAMEFIQVKMVKEVRNYVNRTTNFQTANLSKTTSASLLQIKAIKHIEEVKGKNFLADDLKELAILRVKNPDMSLKELGENLKVPLSRSGVNHRLKKIIYISECIGKEEC